MEKLGNQSVNEKMKAAVSTLVFYELFNWRVGDNGKWTEDIDSAAKDLFRTHDLGHCLKGRKPRGQIEGSIL